MDNLLLVITDAAREVSGARFGAFFYNARSEAGEYYTLYTLVRRPACGLRALGLPRRIFGPTFREAWCSPTRTPRYGRRTRGAGARPVCSYLAVSVMSRNGEVLGGLFFGHPDPGVFTEEHEQLVSGIALSRRPWPWTTRTSSAPHSRTLAEHERTGAALRSSSSTASA